MFRIAAVGGIVLVTLPCFIFPPSRLNMVLLGVYDGFAGLVMFMILAFANPFASPGAVAPAASVLPASRSEGWPSRPSRRSTASRTAR
jgi:hypothetical protein